MTEDHPKVNVCWRGTHAPGDDIDQAATHIDCRFLVEDTPDPHPEEDKAWPPRGLQGK